MITRDYHHTMIDAFTDELNAAMKEKSDAYSGKRPLSRESVAELCLGRMAESKEVEQELFRIRRSVFNTHRGMREALLEVADYCLYAAEDLRRLGVITMKEREDDKAV